MAEKSPDLASEEEARDVLGGAAFDEALEAGELRRVRHDGAEYLLGADVDKVARESDPRWLARHAAGEVDDDGDSPRDLAAKLPRL